MQVNSLSPGGQQYYFQQNDNMKRFIVFTAAIVMAGMGVYACDMCGGAAGNQYIGLLPGFNRNFAGIQYLSGSFSGTFPSFLIDKPNDEHTNDHYNTVQAWGRHRMGRYYQVFAFVPYQYNVRYGGGLRSVNSGLGDITLLLNRVFMSPKEGKWKQTLFGGAGVKLPTGLHAASNDGSMPSMNPGTGTCDFTFNTNYTLLCRKAGINMDVSGTVTTKASNNYKFGNRLGAGLSGFYALQIGECRVTPQAGLRYEYATEDYYNYERNWVNTASGGYVLSATAGAQVSYKNYGLRVNCLLPVNQHYAAGQIVANYKTEAGIFFLF